MSEEQIRAEFEAFLVTQMPTFPPELLFERRENGEYVSLVAHYSWKAWQAAFASQAKSMPIFWLMDLDDKLTDISSAGWDGKELSHDYPNSYLSCVEVSCSLPLYASPQPTDDRVLKMVWHPIDTAPKDNKRPLFIARFNDDGSMQSFDYDAIWKSERESWELPEVYYYWASANGNVEEPTHWCFEPEGFSKLPAKAIEAMKEAIQ